MEYDGYQLAISLIVATSHTACMWITDKNPHIRTHFEFFGPIFTVETINGLFAVIIGTLLYYTDDLPREISAPVLDVLRWIASYFCIILPFLYLVFIMHTILSSSEKYRLITVRFAAVVLTIVCVAYPISELLGFFNRMSLFYTFSRKINLMSEYTEIVNFLMLIGSFCCVDLKKTASLHRLLLIVAVAVHLTSNRIVGLRSFPIDRSSAYAWLALPLFFPAVYYFATRKHEMDEKKGEEEQKIDTASVI